MASARDLITIFVALETISIPTFILAAYRKHDRESNEAGVKYYLIGVLSSALMLYGMSLIFGYTGSTLLSDISEFVTAEGTKPAARRRRSSCRSSGSRSRSSAVPFHFWAPDTYEGAPTPVTAFLSVASKAGGFVALLNIIFFGFYGTNGVGADLWWPAVWVLAAASMTLGNLGALRQTNIVRMLAYSSIAQGGFMLVPFAAAGIAAAEREPGSRRLRDRRGRHLPPHLRRDEPRRVRGRHRRRAAHAVGRDHDLRRAVPDVARARGDDDDLHGVARRYPTARGLVRQVRDVPLGDAGRQHVGDDPRGDRGRQLGDRVLLLRDVIRAMWFNEPATEDRSRDHDPARARWRDRDHRCA